MNIYVHAIYNSIYSCTCKYMYIHVYNFMKLTEHVHTCLYNVQTRMYSFTQSCQGGQDSRCIIYYHFYYYFYNSFSMLLFFLYFPTIHYISHQLYYTHHFYYYFNSFLVHEPCSGYAVGTNCCPTSM